MSKEKKHNVSLEDSQRRRYLDLWYSTYERPLYYRAIGSLKDELRAEEVVQDTFINVWQYTPLITMQLVEEKKKELSYLFVILKNCINKKFMKNRSMKEQIMAYSLFVELDRMATDIPYEEFQNRANELAKKYIQNIQYRKALEYFLEGYKREEIAEMLNVENLNTISTYLFRAKQILIDKILT